MQLAKSHSCLRIRPQGRKMTVACLHHHLEASGTAQMAAFTLHHLVAEPRERSHSINMHHICGMAAASSSIVRRTWHEAVKARRCLLSLAFCMLLLAACVRESSINTCTCDSALPGLTHMNFLLCEACHTHRNVCQSLYIPLRQALHEPSLTFDRP